MSNVYSGERFLPEECKGEMQIEHYQRYQFARELVEGKCVLDAACGEGYGSRLLAEKARRVVGLDIDVQVVENANLKYGNDRLSYVAGSVEKLPFDENSFDVIVSYETIEHIDANKQELFLSEIQRVLKPDGILIMSTPNKAVYTDLVKGTNEFHVREFYVKEFKQFLGNAFNNIEFLCQYPDTGYFIVREGECVQTEGRSIDAEKSRYIIALCSNETIYNDVNLTSAVAFDDSMYYFLNLRVHEQENEIRNMKNETEAFEKRQEETIQEQRQYIEHLECDLREQRQYIEHLERDQEQRQYIEHLECDLREQRQYIEHLEHDIAEVKEYAQKLEEKKR